MLCLTIKLHKHSAILHKSLLTKLVVAKKKKEKNTYI